MMNNQTKPNYSTQLPTKFNPFSTGGEGGGSIHKVVLEFFWTQNFVGPNIFLETNFCWNKYVSLPNFFGHEIFGPKIFFGPNKNFWFKNFVLKRNLFRKKILVRKKMFGPKTTFGPKTFFGTKKF